MKIALYGAMVNNLYVVAKILRRNDCYADYFIECIDRYPAHHPFWLDVFRCLTPQDLAIYQQSQDDFCNQIGWVQPAWVKYLPMASENLSLSTLPHIKSPFTRFIAWRSLTKDIFHRRTFEPFQEYDCIIACGIEALISARLSGKPYIAWIYGADMRIYHGLEPYSGGISALKWHMKRWLLLRDAVDHATAIISNLPASLYVQGAFNVTGRRKHFTHRHLHEMIFPVLQPSEEEESAHSLDLDKSKINILIPSRVDFYWKGQDRFFRAFSSLLCTEKFHIYLLAWGNNQAEAARLVEELGVRQFVTFLPIFATRPALLGLYKQFDLIVDQFCMGTYGTASLEAMSCGKPVLLYLDAQQFSSPEHIPPAINAHTEDDIRLALQNIAEGILDLKELGCRAADWQQRSAGDAAFMANLRQVFHDIGFEAF